MQVEFWMLTPGDHHHVRTVSMDVLPRVDDLVAIEGIDGPVCPVHSVTWVYEPSDLSGFTIRVAMTEN